MTPKEKAQELFNKYHFSFAGVISGEEDWEFLANQCAIIAVDEMIEQQQIQFENMLWSCVEYWKNVKHEIEKL